MESKINIKLLEDNNIILDKNVSFTNDNNTLTFYIDDMKHILDLTNKTLIRENDEYIFTLDILNKKSSIKLKKDNYLLHLKVEYAILLTNQNITEISYRIETHENDMKIILEIEGDLGYDSK